MRLVTKAFDGPPFRFFRKPLSLRIGCPFGAYLAKLRRRSPGSLEIAVCSGTHLHQHPFEFVTTLLL